MAGAIAHFPLCLNNIFHVEALGWFTYAGVVAFGPLSVVLVLVLVSVPSYEGEASERKGDGSAVAPQASGVAREGDAHPRSTPSPSPPSLAASDLSCLLDSLLPHGECPVAPHPPEEHLPWQLPWASSPTG